MVKKTYIDEKAANDLEDREILGDGELMVEEEEGEVNRAENGEGEELQLSPEGDREKGKEKEKEKEKEQEQDMTSMRDKTFASCLDEDDTMLVSSVTSNTIGWPRITRHLLFLSLY